MSVYVTVEVASKPTRPKTYIAHVDFGTGMHAAGIGHSSEQALMRLVEHLATWGEFKLEEEPEA